MGPSYTMAFSSSVRSRKGTSVRTPIARTTSVISDHIRLFQGATAPSSMVRLSSGTRVDRSTVRTVPVPPQHAQAPAELKASSSAPITLTYSPQTGQCTSFSAAQSRVWGTSCPFGHLYTDRRENISRRLFSSSVEVPNVERMPGTPGRWCRARAAGT